jgi:apolipoprotein N-acyltransferase
MKANPARLGWWAVLLLGVAASGGLLAWYARVDTSAIGLAWVVLVPWLFALDRAGSLRDSLIAGVVFSMGFTATAIGWLPGAVRGYTEAPTLVCWLAILLLAPLLLEPQFLTFAVARYLARGGRSAQHTPPSAALIAALVYVGTEWAFPRLFDDTLGSGLYPSVYLRQGADLAGPRGLTLVILLANECVLGVVRWLLARGWRGPNARRVPGAAVALAALVLGGFGYGALRYRQVVEGARQGSGLAVGIAQSNITGYEKLAAKMGTYEVVRLVLDTYFALSDELLHRGELDLLVWPETVYPTTFGSPKSEEGAQFDAEINAFVAKRQVPLIFGTYDVEDEREFNAAMVLGPAREGRLERSVYRKTMLFPLTEWVPDVLDRPWLRRLLPWMGEWKRGPGPRVVTVRLRGGRTLTVAPLICYEATFSGYAAEEARQGADLIVTMSNDSWFSGTSAQRQHLVLAAFRSIETRLPQVRTTSSGISALIDATGEIVSRAPVDQRAGLAVTVPPAGRMRTLVLAWGDWLGPVALLAGLGLLFGRAVAGRLWRG